MDNIIAGAISVVIFLAFVLGLADSIKALPFVLIVVAVCAMLCFDFYQSAREGWQAEKDRKNASAD